MVSDHLFRCLITVQMYCKTKLKILVFFTDGTRLPGQVLTMVGKIGAGNTGQVYINLGTTANRLFLADAFRYLFRNEKLTKSVVFENIFVVPKILD